MEKRLGKHYFIYSLLAGIIGMYLLYLVTQRESLWLDRVISSLLDTTNDITIGFFQSITQLGSKTGIGTAALIMIIWLWVKKKDYIGMATIALAVGIGNEVNKLLKNWIGRPRPDMEHLDHVASLSFPSGHAMVGIIMYMLIAYFLVMYIPSHVGKITTVTSCTIIIFLIGISRVILHVHYPSDVLAGYAFGFIWAFLWMLTYEYARDWLKQKAKSN